MGIRIITPGSLSTVQDLGRYGYQASGFSPSGAADADALRLLNCLLGNDLGEAAIEMTALGLTAEFDSDCVFAITGADDGPELNDEPVKMNTVVKAKKGDILSCKYVKNGIRTYFGVAGGFDIAPVMGSRSTGMKFSVGGFKGRKLASDDVIGFRENISDIKKIETRTAEVPEYQREVVLRVVPGPQNDRFSEEAMNLFTSTEYTVSNSMDRMGIRLNGEAIPSLNNKYDIISDATATGSIQITNDGTPIILLADRQTTGGYTKIATVISSDLPKAGQLLPECKVRFKAVTVEEAQKIFSGKMKELKKLQKKFRR